MSDTIKLIIEIPKEEYLNAKRINWANIRPECIDDYEYQIAHGTPLSEVLTEIKNELEEHKYSREYCSDHRIDFAIDMGMVRIILNKRIFEEESD